MTGEAPSAAEIWSPEQLGVPVSRWQMPRLDEPPPPAPPPPTAEHLEAIEAAAYQEGFERGHRDGYEIGQKSAQTQGQRLRELVDRFCRPLAQMDAEIERLLVELTVAVARRVIHDELVSAPERILSLVREAVAALPPGLRRLRIEAHPDDARLLRAQFPAPPGVAELEIIDAEGLARGEARLSTESALVDAQLDRRLRAVAEALLGDAE